MLSGEMVKNYRLERVLGQGGMGAVWLAVDSKLGRPVAIKFLHDALIGSEDARARFVREAQTVALLRSEHTVRIYDIGALEGVAPYLVMEYLPGDDLEQLLAKQGAFSAQVAVDYVLQACEALAEAHAAGIVHRDIKCANLRLTEGPGKQPWIKVMDFGIAKTGGMTQVTRTDSVIGTPGYMSPEQLRSSTDVDPRTDVWALGVVLFELIAGSRPFEANSFTDLVLKVATEPPKSPPETAPQGLREAILRCLEKDRTGRFANVASLAHSIAPYATDRGEAARLVARARGYLGVGIAGAATMAFVRPIDQPMKRGVESLQEPVDAPWAAFERAIPQTMAGDRAALLEVFARVFGASESVSDSTVKLTDSSFAPDDHTEFFVIFMHAPIELGAQAIGNTTFAAYVGPLRSHLEKLGSARRKVVIVVAGMGELGPGVRDSIGEYRRTLNTFVVPIWVREIQRAYAQDRAWDVFEHRLNELHANHDPFVTDLDSLDPMRCVGMGSRVNEVVSSLKDGGRIINIIALPGSGKSTLVRLVQYELAERAFIVLRCSEVARSPRGLGREILAEISRLASGNAGPTRDPDEEFAEALSSQLQTPFLPRKVLATSLQQLVSPPLLVLEDADWLIAQIASTEASPLRDESRALWTALGEVSRKHKLDVILTSVRGYELDRAMLGGWENPMRPRTVAVALLSQRQTELLVRELAAGIVRFTDDAIAALHRATRGNVGLTLTVCSTAFAAHDQRADDGPLVVATLTAQDIEQAIERVASIDKPIGPLFNSLLSDNERHVLRTIANAPARTQHSIRGALDDRAAVDRAMRELEAMGMVDFIQHRHRVVIPLVAEWARRHLVQTEHQTANEWRSRTRLVAVGAIVSTLLLTAYFVWVRNQRSDQQVVAANGCTYRVDAPDRAEYGVPVVVYAFRSCRELPQDAGLALQARRIAAQIDVTGGESCAAQPECMLEAHVTLKLQKDGRYPFVLTTNKHELLELELEHDALAGLKGTLSDVFRLMSLLPVVLCTGLAFYSDVLKAVRSWFKRGDTAASDTAAPPATGSTS